MQPVSAFHSSQNIDSVVTTSTNYPQESEIDDAGIFEINLSVDSSFSPGLICQELCTIIQFWTTVQVLYQRVKLKVIQMVNLL